VEGGTVIDMVEKRKKGEGVSHYCGSDTNKI
jgi:hypothetical protein